ncbi:MAG TPA: matrixin family metalloprotease [Gemmatimonadaceae bacterium]|jgi:predicted Zn-dependent protease
MRRIEFWLLGAVGALITFVVFESVKSTMEPHHNEFQIAQAGKPRGRGLGDKATAADASEASDAPLMSTTVDVHSAVQPSRTRAPERNVADIRRRIADGAQHTYIADLLASQDSMLYRWPDNRDEGVRVWIQSDAHVRDWWVGYVQSARDVFLEWQTAGIPLRFVFPSDSAGADIVVRWIDQFPVDEMRIGKTRRLADQNAWVTHAEVIVALHDRDGDTFPPGEISEILRHEIGHALGLGHSRNRGTIMYPENTQLDLTEMDKETLHLLYSLPPGRVR